VEDAEAPFLSGRHLVRSGVVVAANLGSGYDWVWFKFAEYVVLTCQNRVSSAAFSLWRNPCRP